MYTHVYPHTHIWALASVSAMSPQWWELSGFGILFDGSVPLLRHQVTSFLCLTFLPSHTHTHTHTHTLTWSLHPSWKYWWDSVAIKNTGAIFIFCGGCNGKEKVSVPIVSRGNASLSFTGTNTHMHTHTHTHTGKRSQSWQGKRDTRKPQYTVSRGGSTWNRPRLFNVLCEKWQTSGLYCSFLLWNLNSVYSIQLHFSLLFFQGDIKSQLSQILSTLPPLHYWVTSHRDAPN